MAITVFVSACALFGAAQAADLDMSLTHSYATYGVPCDSSEAHGFESVWLGHFTGGEAAYSGVGGSTLLDWHDEKLCFPSRRSCDQWIAGMRRDFHRPAGYFTCLVIR